MREYKFLGVTKYAEAHLTGEDIEQLTEMKGCTVYEGEPSIVDGKKTFIMPDGEVTHIDFLEIEELQEELPFETLL